MRLAVTIILGLAAISVAYADHNSLHECNYLMPGYTPDRFQDLGDGTVYDNRTGLVWQRCAYGQTWDSTEGTCTGIAQTLTWQEALQNAPSGFRLPNIKELASLLNLQCYGPALNATVFPRAPSSPIVASNEDPSPGLWSATASVIPDAGGQHTNAWAMGTYEGRLFPDLKTTGNFALYVKTGP